MVNSKLTSLSFILEDQIEPGNLEWSFTVPNLPSAEKINSSGHVKSIRVVSNDKKQSITLCYVRAPTSRATAYDSLDRFVLISFADFRLRYPRRTRTVSGEDETSSTLATATESANYVTKLLQSGVTLNGITYNFYGHSNSQLKSRTCVLFAAPKEVISRKIDGLGDLSSIKSVGKKAKRIGLLFSAAEIACGLPSDCCEDIPDVANKDYNFTDGCGLISSQFAKTLVKRVDIKFRNQSYVPSVFQIRYRGYKGVLTTDPSIKGKIKVKFRDSMQKFKGGEDLSFSVIDYAKPYAFGSLNDEVILLLHSLGISEAVLVRRQQEHFDFLAAAGSDPRAAFQFLTYISSMDLAERVLLDGIETMRTQIISLTNQELRKLLNAKGVQRSRIMIPKSRLLFGVCDSAGVLREGECAVKITLEETGLPQALTGMEILVTRNPCLHPGDLQKFRVVAKPELSHLTDCIVFPVRGRRPSSDMMSGGDLDGDKFFVCWDPDLVPSKLSQPARYEGAKEPINLKPISDDDRLQYFARYNNASLGRVKNLFLGWARAKGPMCEQCQELNHLFSQSVDGNRIKIPKHLEDPPQPASTPFILDTLHKAAEDYVDFRRTLPQKVDEISFDVMQLLLSRENFAMTEFELIELTCRWCTRNQAKLSDFIEYFDFSQLSDEEKAWVLIQLPASIEFPSLVLNGLLSSNLVVATELHQHQMDHPGIHWKIAFDSARDRMALFLEATTRVLQDFHKKVILLRLEERLTIAIYVPQKIEKGCDFVVDDKVRLFAFPHSHKDSTFHGCAVTTKKTYRLYYDEGGLQLYQAHRSNTWVFITKPGANNLRYKDLANQGEQRRTRQETVDVGLNQDSVISVALDKFSKSLQTHLGRVNRNPIIAAEIYVISNRDLRSLRILDLWLQQIDTEGVMPLFQQEAKEYNLRGLSTVEWSNEPEHLRKIVQDQDFSYFHGLETKASILSIFQWTWEKDERMLLQKIYQYILARPRSTGVGEIPLVSAMIEFVHVVPPLSTTFADVDAWTNRESPIYSTLVEGAPKLLLALITSAEEVPGLVVEPFKRLLSHVPYMTLSDFATLLRMASLTIRSSDTALDILMGSLESESVRLLVARPTIKQHFVKSLIGLALDHVEEARNARVSKEILLDLVRGKDEGTVVSRMRIDAKLSTPLQQSDHVCLMTATSSKNSLIQRTYRIDAIVKTSEQGQITLECYHAIPPYVEDCSWKVTHCGSFVTTQAMMDAICSFAMDSAVRCPVQKLLLGLPDDSVEESETMSGDNLTREDLNDSQNAALHAAVSSPLTLLWGPPGTGKSHTIVAILQELLLLDPSRRILVAAPTHNAVDNVMRKYVEKVGDLGNPIRVSTDIRKVAEDIRKYTCDAMVGKELREDFKAQKIARRQIRDARLVFTTCIGAALGLLRKETFSTVVIDEASQQTEPMSIVPLVKGCTKAILVGDHVQLRATVQPLATLQQFEISLFERLYYLDSADIQKVMLDSQYRMHQDICRFSSEEFYDGRLNTAIQDGARPLSASQFPWPASRRDEHELSRMVFVPCAGTEDIGHKSKSNSSQATLCHSICKRLLASSDTTSSPAPTYSIAVLTPYTRQVDRLKSLLPPTIAISSIDGFQGREADIVIFVTVRCNVHAEIGFLKDLRRLNVAMTRAKTACIIIGDKSTLTKGPEEEESVRVWKRLILSLDEVKIVD